MDPRSPRQGRALITGDLRMRAFPGMFSKGRSPSRSFGPFSSHGWTCFPNCFLTRLWSPLGMTGAGKTQSRLPRSAVVLADDFCLVHLPGLWQ